MAVESANSKYWEDLANIERSDKGNIPLVLSCVFYNLIDLNLITPESTNH